MPPTHRITRRRALLLGAAAGLGGAFGRPWPLLSGARAAAPSRPRSFGMDVPGDAFAGGRVTGVLRAPRRFDLLGLRGAGLRDARLDVRVRRRGGAWSAWVPVGAGTDHAPDRPRHALAATDPVWAGGADELQLRARRPVGGLRIHFVAVPRPARGAARAARTRARTAQAAGGAPVIIPREQWGGDKVKPRADPSYGEVQMAFVHHTVGANDYTPEQSAGIVLAIAKYHRDSNGWNDIGYNFLVDKYGQVFEGRAGGVDQPVIGAQAQGWNSKSTGVATLGTYQDVALPDPAVQSISRLIAWKLTLHGVPSVGQVSLVSGGGSQNRYKYGAKVSFERISGHRDGCTTECPGNALYGQLDEIRGRAAALAGVVASVPRLTLDAESRAVRYGRDAVFSGRLMQADGTPVIAARIDLQKQGSKSFVTVARATTGEDGRWSARVPWRRGAAVRARSRLGGGDTVVSSPQTTVDVVAALRVLRPATRSRVLAGRGVALRGTVHPPVGVRVRVERQDRSGRWRRVSDGALRVRRSAFASSIRLRAPGLYRITVRTADGRADPVFVRAVRRARSVPGSGANGGAGTAAAPPSGGFGAN